MRRYCQFTVFFLTTFFHIGLRGRGVVDEHYVTLGGCTVQRYEALQGGGGGVKFLGKKRYVTLEWLLIVLKVGRFGSEYRTVW